MSQEIKEIYNKYLQTFKERVKEEYIYALFNRNKNQRIELKIVHTKN